jgi:chromosome segregation protein
LYLAKLEIFGFKSFAQKTAINFNEGITSIVGPNGCGKTNIVDAIRWCLGEQRSGALRSDKMENVIFNGTSNKKPMGMAEVSLVIHNTKGILPTEYTDVTITRRIFRSGESEYLLNKNLCRLKDITNLFMDTGIGANAYSVIELKMVETILSDKADERRTMFEEAAGVNKYKLRRRLALRKLDDVKADLTRVNDIVTEVEKKVNYLERQAKKAERYNKISTRLRELELDLADREYALYHLQRDEHRIRKNEFFEKRLRLDSDSAKQEEELNHLKHKLNEIESVLKEKRSSVQFQTEKIYNLQNQILIADERKKSITSNINNYELELNELNNQQKNVELFTSNNRNSLEDFASRIWQKENEKLLIIDDTDKLRGNLEEKRRLLKAQTELLLEKVKEIANKENELTSLDRMIEGKIILSNKLNHKIQILTGNIAKTVGFIEDLDQEKFEVNLKFQEAEAVYNQKQTEKEEYEKQLNLLKEKELEDRGLLNGIRDRINFIQTLIDNLEGVSKGAKALLENDNWNNGDKSLLAHIGNTSENYRIAVEASLKNNLNTILIESIDDLKKGISFLKDNEIGKAAFYVAKPENQSEKFFFKWFIHLFSIRNYKALEKENGFVAWAKNLIQTEDKWKIFFEKYLNKTAVVNSIENAFKLSRKYSDFNFVTVDGDFIDQFGIVEGGSIPKIDDSVFGRKQLLQNLKGEFSKQENELVFIKNKIDEIEEKVSSIDLKILSEQGRMLQNDIANLEKQIAQFEFERKKADDEIEKAMEEIKDIAIEMSQLNNEVSNLKSILAIYNEEKRKADEEFVKLEVDFKFSEDNYNSTLANQNRVNLELERLSGEKKNIENSIDRALESLELIKKSQIKRQNDLTNLNNELVTLENTITEKVPKLSELEKVKSSLLKEEEEIEFQYGLIRDEINKLEINLASLRKQREQLTDEIHALDIKVNELDVNISNLKNIILENYSVHLEIRGFENLLEFNFNQRTDDVHALKQQIKNLGPINVLAYSEYEEERERFEFLKKQRDDLLESERDIVKTIEEINVTAQTLFMETFEKIRENFIKIFRNLFNPGDEADLRLGENADPLEARIEIIAKPKGKRPTSIELLSGGEKTLTAIALLFAIYLVKPSPFCILDEIDAPLDDANIDRFTRILNDFSTNTQFIVVTHNKRTMESASTLYGVTMQEEGISKLVSVRFNEELNFAS